MEEATKQYAIRSKTGGPYRSSGVLFPHGSWTVVPEPTDEQHGEHWLDVRELEPGATHIDGYPVAYPAEAQPEEDSAPIDSEAIAQNWAAENGYVFVKAEDAKGAVLVPQARLAELEAIEKAHTAPKADTRTGGAEPAAPNPASPGKPKDNKGK